MRIVAWLLRAFIFFTLFAFALNNQQPATVRWFFGVEWHAPMVIIVLAAFALGAAIGVLAMAPGWWRMRRALQGRREGLPGSAPAASAPPPTSVLPSGFGSEAALAHPAAQPPRNGP
jgi:lipopolysaccharide assembly protein A